MEQARTSSISTSPVMMIASNTCLKSNGKMTLLYVQGVAILIESGKTKCARFEKRNVQKSGKTKRSKNFAHTTL